MSVIVILRQLLITDDYFFCLVFCRLRSLYPSCSSGWVEKAEDLQLCDIKPSLYYRPADEIASAIRNASLVWVKGDMEKSENQQQPDDREVKRA